MNRYVVIFLVSTGLFFSGEGLSQGISFDAGLTPAEGRIIIRSQYRHIYASSPMIGVTTQMVPVVFAYGVRPGLTVMARNMYFNRSFSDSRAFIRGIHDPFVMAKFRVYRKNTASWVLGIAPHIGVNLPVGAEGVSSGTWNPQLGLNASFRPRYLSLDISMAYEIKDLFHPEEATGDDIFTGNVAFSGIVPVNDEGSVVLAPVIELNYLREGIPGSSRTDPGTFLLASPGFSLITSKVAFEGLLQLPVYQSAGEEFLKQRYRVIVGVKLLF